MERLVLSGDAFRREGAAVLYRTFFHDGNQLQLLSHSERENIGKLGDRHAGEISFQPQSAAGNYSHPEVARLRGSSQPIYESTVETDGKAWADSFPTAAVFKKDLARLEDFLGALPRELKCA